MQLYTLGFTAMARNYANIGDPVFRPHAKIVSCPVPRIATASRGLVGRDFGACSNAVADQSLLACSARDQPGDGADFPSPNQFASRPADRSFDRSAQYPARQCRCNTGCAAWRDGAAFLAGQPRAEFAHLEHRGEHAPANHQPVASFEALAQASSGQREGCAQATSSGCRPRHAHSRSRRTDHRGRCAC